MKERKVQVNIKRHHVRQRRNRSWVFSPVIVTQLALIMVLAGIGVAFALPQNTVGNAAIPWAGTASIQQSTHFTVANYSLIYSANLSQVTGMNVSLTNNGGTTAKVNVAVLNTSSGVIAIANGSQSYPTGWYPFTLNTSVLIASVDTMNVIVTEP